MVTFTNDGPTQQNVSATITDDSVANENNEMVNVRLMIVSASADVIPGAFTSTMVTIVDNDCKSATIK